MSWDRKSSACLYEAGSLVLTGRVEVVTLVERGATIAKLLVLAATLFGGWNLQAAEVTPAAVAAETRSMVKRIKAAQTFTGAWLFPGNTTGFTALNVLALASAGVPEDDPVMQKAIKYLKRSFPRNSTYAVGLYAMAFEAVDRKKYWREIKKATDWLVARQVRGTWNYGGNGPGDHSVSQFAMLGLKAGKDANVPIPFSVFKEAERHFRGAQNRDGGWGYRAGVGVDSTVAMTPAGLSSLYACGVQPETSLEVDRGPEFIGRYVTDPAISRGLKWMNGSIGEAMKNPYAAYGLERVGIFFDQRSIGGEDWYKKGCAAILHGRIDRDRRHCPDQFLLLFLAKGNIPVLVNKARWSEDDHWNLRRADSRNMVKFVADEFQQKLDWQAVPLDLDDPDFAKAPILQISGHKRFATDEKGRKAVRTFVDEGGTVLLTPNQQGPGFVREVTRELQQIWSGARFEPVPPNHRLRGMFHDLYGRQLPLLVLKSGCSPFRVFLCEEDLSLAFESGLPDEISQMIALNLARYALNEQPLVDRLAERKLEEDKERVDDDAPEMAEGAREGGLAVARLAYDGDFNPESKSMANFQGFLRQAVNMPSAKAPVDVWLRDPSLRRNPVLYLTGYDQLPFSSADKAALKSYLLSGGFLVADAGCSRKSFDEQFRLLMTEMFPDNELEAVPVKSPVYHEPFELKPEPTKALARIFDPEKPWVYGIRHNERYVALYSPYDFGSAMEGHVDEDSAAFKAPSAYRIMTNLVHYGLSY
jgi:hypothetical protein